MIKEEFREHPELKGYMIGNHGTVTSPRNRRLKATKNEQGYYIIQTYFKNQTRRHRLHKLMAEAWLENPNNCTLADLVDGDKDNVTLCNIEWRNGGERRVRKELAARPVAYVSVSIKDRLEERVRELKREMLQAESRLKLAQGNSFAARYKEQLRIAKEAHGLNIELLRNITGGQNKSSGIPMGEPAHSFNEVTA